VDESLATTGWRPAPPVTAIAMLGWLNPNSNLGNLPVLPHVSAGHFEASRWIRDSGVGSRQVLRLWDSGVRLTATGEPNQPLWLGTLEVQTVIHPIGLLSYAQPTLLTAGDIEPIGLSVWNEQRNQKDGLRIHPD
jgi:hypothetical protein